MQNELYKIENRSKKKSDTKYIQIPWDYDEEILTHLITLELTEVPS
jgi:hypothetical protein